MLDKTWNFGPVGNPAWRHLPETRETIKELVCDELERAIYTDDPPGPVDHFMYAIHAVGPLFFDRLGVVELDPDLVRRFCLFCHDMLDYAEPDDDDGYAVSHTFDMYIIDGTDHPAAVRILRQVDSALVDRVHELFPGRWAEELDDQPAP